jgi:hypothetical protein
LAGYTTNIRSSLLPRDAILRSTGLRWSTFLRLHAQGIIACDFFVAVTATFRQLHVFVIIEHHSRRLIHCNVTAQSNGLSIRGLFEVASV